MQHDQHFLTRLERLEREHAEIALGLYYDSGLVRHILRVAKVPDQAERVALCLGAPERGPHVIVARDGHFVTCLGEDMQLRADQAVISRHALDVISQDLGALRSLVADAEAGSSRQRLRKLRRVFEAGPGLSQEEFEAVGRWLPLLARDFLVFHVEASVYMVDLVDRLARVKKWNQRYDELLHEYWRKSWTTAHLSLLLGADGGKRMRALFEVAETHSPGLSQQMTWGMVRSGIAPFALRGAWLASKLPTWIVPQAKRRYLDRQVSFLTTLTDGLSLIAVALRHRKYHGEVAKVLARGNPKLADGLVDKASFVRAYCAEVFEPLVEDIDPHREHLVGISRELTRRMYPNADANLLAAMEAMSDDTAVATFMMVPHPIEHEVDSLRGLFMRLPWVVGADAKSFYLPERYANVFRGPYTRAEGLALFEPRKGLGIGRQQPIIAAPKIGPNQACPCGSGTKFKRCCGAGPDEVSGPDDLWS